MPNVPEKPTLDGLEAKWIDRWDADGTYRFDRSKPREQIYSVDTPPPTVSGDLHLGHCFSYAQTDLVVRFQRMRGKEVFYPVGWDDNGLPTERRTQRLYGVRCDPSIPYDPNFTPPERPGKEQVPVSRPNFVELCNQVTIEDEKAYEEVFKKLGLSVDWSTQYTTIGEKAQRASQRSFLRLLGQDRFYKAEAPTLWDVDFRSSIAQAELEDREIAGVSFRVRFARADGSGDIEIETTRPELIPSCVALVAHPNDARYAPLFGTTVRTPLFEAAVPVVSHHLADPEKGTGIAMVCTFGDITDVTWWRELDLPLRMSVEPDGTLRRLEWDSPEAQKYQDEISGLYVKKAQKRIAELLRESGALVGDPRPLTHPVKFYQYGERPLEILTSRQWFFRSLHLKDDLLARGKELDWHPEWMQSRYESWVMGLNSDWNVSRQRFFGVPFPVWYPIDKDGNVEYDRPIVASEDRLPVDPSTEVPDGYQAEQRDMPGGFGGDPDVMDTWATSSLTPQIAGGWEDDPDLFARVFPMDLRPQAHDIIRTWLFYTVLRSHVEHGTLPWRSAGISGFIVDSDREKMSKSKGTAIYPMEVTASFGADAIRYWAASQRLGVDTVYDEGVVKIGRRLAIKILNASKFVLSKLSSDGPITNALDRSMLHRLAAAADEATQAFEGYHHNRSLERTETFFWTFCDDYLELVKGRAYGSHNAEEEASANRALSMALSALLRMFAPFLPYVTEEVWSWWQHGSIHRASWPTAAELTAAAGEGNGLVLDVASAVLGEVRKAKTAAKQSLKAEVAKATVHDTSERLAALREAEADLSHAGSIRQLVMSEGDFSVEVELA